MASTGDWPGDIKLPASPAHLEALGAFALIYNQIELLLYSALRVYMPGPSGPCERLFASLHNRERVDLILAFAASEERGDVRDAVSHMLRCFEICAENRNLLLHGVSYAQDGDTVTLIKTTSNKPLELTHYDFTLADIRGAATSADVSLKYLTAVVAWLRLREAKPEIVRTLPGKPPQPRKLSLSRRSEAQSGGKPPPQS